MLCLKRQHCGMFNLRLLSHMWLETATSAALYKNHKRTWSNIIANSLQKKNCCNLIWLKPELCRWWRYISITQHKWTRVSKTPSVMGCMVNLCHKIIFLCSVWPREGTNPALRFSPLSFRNSTASCFAFRSRMHLNEFFYRCEFYLFHVYTSLFYHLWLKRWFSSCIAFFVKY